MAILQNFQAREVASRGYDHPLGFQSVHDECFLRKDALDQQAESKYKDGTSSHHTSSHLGAFKTDLAHLVPIIMRTFFVTRKDILISSPTSSISGQVTKQISLIRVDGSWAA